MSVHFWLGKEERIAVRRVRRIIRKIDPWTVLRVTIILNSIAGLIWTLGVWVAWSIAVQRGIPDAFVELFGRLTIVVTTDGDLYFRVVLMFAIVWVIAMTAAMTMAAVLYNLISDIVGGVEIVMLEETNDAPPASTIPPRPVVQVPASNGNSALNAEDTVETG
ncbi:MAG: DUF3566 domain-containing protein [Acidimicrobiia bacterium]